MHFPWADFRRRPYQLDVRKRGLSEGSRDPGVKGCPRSHSDGETAEWLTGQTEGMQESDQE